MKRTSLLWSAMTATITIPVALSIWLGVESFLTGFLITLGSITICSSNPLLKALWMEESQRWERWKNMLALQGVILWNLILLVALVWSASYFLSESFMTENTEDVPSVLTTIISLGISWLLGVLLWIPPRKKPEKSIWRTLSRIMKKNPQPKKTRLWKR